MVVEAWGLTVGIESANELDTSLERQGKESNNYVTGKRSNLVRILEEGV